MKRDVCSGLLFFLVLCCSPLLKADTIWVDVRSMLEHRIDNISGDVRISHGEIVERAADLFPDKNAEIHLYCAGGVRAAKALVALEEAGYKNVSNAGGIDDARRARGISK